MSKESVIAMRNSLKGNKNIPVRVYADNDFIIVDEAVPVSFTKWDDVNGVLYVFRLATPEHSRIASNQKAISVGAVLYEFIQAMEVSPLPLSKFDDVISSMQDNGITFNNNFDKQIKYVFEQILRNDRVDLTNEEVNELIGSKVKDWSDDYYNGKFTEPFKETRPQASRNEYVEKTNLNNNDGN